MARFKTRARAVDMLGRQQVAGIPTAISELFKNAHDAYADRVWVDFIRPEQLFVLRDDGTGMTRADFEGRWLTLGTESKLGPAAAARPSYVSDDKRLRPVLGEKGIGRLAIAAIGPQVLVMTRPTRGHEGETEAGDLTAAFIHWSLFEIPGIDLDQIDLPVRTFPGGMLPTAQDVSDMVACVRDVFADLASEMSEIFRVRIAAQLEAFRVDPVALDRALGEPSLTGNGHGTHFIICPTDESLIPAIEEGGDADVPPPLIKTLIGFTNTMTPDHKPPVIHTAFRDHKVPGVVDDVIAESEFFTADEFRNADHHIEGRFDEFGQFVGTVTVYGEPTAQYVVPWTSAGGNQTACGPFRINVAVVQGVANQSTLPPNDWALMSRKLIRMGGLYIYRDGIRVLPYGNNDYDFLDMERNRTKSASYYYFSYRRIFGVIEIDRQHNDNLVEKAGREGFRENRAYREFREILQNFFIQIAADFFREGGVRAERYHEHRADLERIELARRRREKHTAERRKAFRQELDAALTALERGDPRLKAEALLDTLDRDLAVATAGGQQRQGAAAEGIIDAEARARGGLAQLRESFRVVPPRGVGLPQANRREFERYRDEFDQLEGTLFTPTAEEIEIRLAEAARNTGTSIDRRRRFDRSLAELTVEVRRKTQRESQQVRAAADDVQERVTALARESIADVDRAVKQVLSDAARIDVTHLDDSGFVAERTRLEETVQRAADEEQQLLTAVLAQLQAVVWSKDGMDGAQATTAVDEAEALEEEVLALRERADANLELAQLGTAIQVINHEFDHTIRGVRSGLRELKAWADTNDSLNSVYGKLRQNFDHLDGYLTLFTPLQRRLYRRAITFSGNDIAKFIRDLFRDRLERHDVELVTSTSFRKYQITGYPSTFYPVFVNLVDNAIYWLLRTKGPRRIALDTVDDALRVANSGAPLLARDREAVFGQGFTRKPAGRGLGLYIAKQVLLRDGYYIRAAEPPDGMGAAFTIGRIDGADSDDPEAIDDANMSGLATQVSDASDGAH